tara:strand:- start:2587 stop:3432 length:846 start_codon:yes stop_codon:yes gene_type:complete
MVNTLSKERPYYVMDGYEGPGAKNFVFRKDRIERLERIQQNVDTAFKEHYTFFPEKYREWIPFWETEEGTSSWPARLGEHSYFNWINGNDFTKLFHSIKYMGNWIGYIDPDVPAGSSFQAPCWEEEENRFDAYYAKDACYQELMEWINMTIINLNLVKDHIDEQIRKETGHAKQRLSLAKTVKGYEKSGKIDRLDDNLLQIISRNIHRSKQSQPAYTRLGWPSPEDENALIRTTSGIPLGSIDGGKGKKKKKKRKTMKQKRKSSKKKTRKKRRSSNKKRDQ